MLLPLLLTLAALPTELTLREGEKRVVRFDDLSLVAVADPDILSANAQGEQVTLTGLATGSTELRIFLIDGNSAAIPVKVSRTGALPDAQELTVEVGTSRTIEVLPSRGAEAIDAKVAAVELQGRFLIIRALSEGRTAIVSTDSHNEKHTAWLTVTAPKPAAPPDAGTPKPPAAAAPPLTTPVLTAVGLTVGATTALSFSGVTRALTRDSSVVRVGSDGQGHLVLTGVAPGTATVSLVAGRMTMFLAVTVDP